MKNDVLELLFSISLKTRIIREWQKANRAHDQAFSERELLVLELINDFAPITEKGLCKIFGLAFSSVSEMVSKLANAGLIDTAEKARGKPLVLTKDGIKQLEKLKQASAIRFSYLLQPLDPKETAFLLQILGNINKNAEQQVQQLVFDRYSEE